MNLKEQLVFGLNLILLERICLINFNASRCDFSSAEIELFFSRMDDNGDGILDIHESGDAVEELNENPQEEDTEYVYFFLKFFPYKFV